MQIGDGRSQRIGTDLHRHVRPTPVIHAGGVGAVDAVLPRGRVVRLPHVRVHLHGRLVDVHVHQRRVVPEKQ